MVSVLFQLQFSPIPIPEIGEIGIETGAFLQTTNEFTLIVFLFALKNNVSRIDEIGISLKNKANSFVK